MYPGRCNGYKTTAEAGRGKVPVGHALSPVTIPLYSAQIILINRELKTFWNINVESFNQNLIKMIGCRKGEQS